MGGGLLFLLLITEAAVSSVTSNEGDTTASERLQDYLLKASQALAIARHLRLSLHGPPAQSALEVESRLAVLNEASEAAQRRRLKLVELGAKFQAQLYHLQHPKDCSKVHFAFKTLRECGFGCRIHHIAFALHTAIVNNQTLFVVHFTETFHGLFLPLTPCPKPAFPGPVHKVKDYDQLRPDSLSPPALSKEWADLLEPLHESPYLWLRGQMIRYILRPSEPHLVHFVDSFTARIRRQVFGNVFVGVHVRRTDKLIEEAKMFPLKDYMRHADDYYDFVRATNSPVKDPRKPGVFLATDDASVIQQFLTTYPNYTLFHNNVSQINGDQIHLRYTDIGMQSIFLDVMILANADHLVCTFSSNVCRMAHALKQTLNDRYGDRTHHTDSLDSAFFIIGSQNTTQRNWLSGGQFKQEEVPFANQDVVIRYP